MPQMLTANILSPPPDAQTGNRYEPLYFGRLVWPRLYWENRSTYYPPTDPPPLLNTSGLAVKLRCTTV